ncbi:MAG: DNA polymerase III subunit gamma/tau, partial [Candidatus Thioglobus sp.]|nr:DNA polymerase III subunit gamma/tau [Candidatus Thioglobus sp.]
TQISNQDLQLFYHMALNGTKDMALAPSEQIGFEMTLLRMLAFHSKTEVLTEKKTPK